MATANPILSLAPLSRVRRNHALEHATLQVLAERRAGLRLAGYSDPNGFWIVGQVELDDLAQAVESARSRLLAGESRLAIHPNCGTNFAASGLLAGLAAWLVMLGTGSGWRSKLDRLPLVTSLVTLVLILSHPLGPALQRAVTTDPHLGSLHVVRIDRTDRGGLATHRVTTRG